MENTIFICDTSPLGDNKVFEKYFSQISPFRKEKIDSLKIRKDKNLSLAATILLDTKLKTIGLCESDVKYGTNPFGKPHLCNVENFHFNISHSGNFAICAFSENPVGCDIQMILPQKRKVADRFFANDEIEYLKNFSDCDFDSKFCEIWSLKESFIKAVGRGFSIPISDFSMIDNKKISNRIIFEDKSFYFYKKSFMNYHISACFSSCSLQREINFINL